MTDQPNTKAVKSMLLNISAVVIVLMAGCASHKNAGVVSPASKRIIDIVISENSEALFFRIKGNQPLKYTVQEQSTPNGVLFEFADTALDIGEGVYSPPGSGIISFIKTIEIATDKTTSSRIFVALADDTPYDLKTDQDGLNITFQKTGQNMKSVKSPNQTIVEKTEPKPVEKEVPDSKPIEKKMTVATLLKAVTARPQVDKAVVDVEANGAITDYKSFIMDNPARIVLDMPGIKSPHKTEKRIAVDSVWVQRIRYFGHPGKVRLVLETHENYLSKYWIEPAETGLLIGVGQPPKASATANQAKKDGNLETKRVTLTWDKVPDATSYNVYLSNSPGVTRQNGLKISNVKNNYTAAELKSGTAYYFVVTAVNASGESKASEEIKFIVGD
jgi:hypothetical protein